MIQYSDPFSADFLFLSEFQSFTANGCFTRLTQPLCQRGRLSDSFQNALQAAFRAARAAGIVAPRLCGAIAFDSRQPSMLFIPETVQKWDRKIVLAQACADLPAPLPAAHWRDIPDQAAFMHMVTQGLNAIRQQHVRKVVLARLLDLQTCQPVAIRALMRRIVAANPAEYCFQLSTAQGVLFGASPELLVRKSGAHFTSAPLAGTARRACCPEEDAAVGERLLTCAKDLHEHQVVTDAMRQALAMHSRQLLIPAFPELRQTASLWHLCTPIRGEVADAGQNALSLACLLHPTPALCGAPTDAAFELIRRLEPFDRGLFGGIVGWCDERGDGEWVVTIRSALVKDHQVRLFAGAGIVADSQPLAEWRETGAKLNTLLQHFAL